MPQKTRKKKTGVTRGKCKEPLILFSLEETYRRVRKTTPTPEFHAFCSTTFPTLMAAAIDYLFLIWLIVGMWRQA